MLQTTITLWIIIIGQSEDKKDAECADKWFYLFLDAIASLDLGYESKWVSKWSLRQIIDIIGYWM